MSYRFMLPAQWKRGSLRPAGTGPAHLVQVPGGYLPFCLEFTGGDPHKRSQHSSASARALDRCRTATFTTPWDVLLDDEDC